MVSGLLVSDGMNFKWDLNTLFAMAHTGVNLFMS